MYITIAAELIVAPIMSRLYIKGDKERLRLIVNKAVRLSFALSLPIGGIFLTVGSDILNIFGHDFILANGALMILVVGKLISIALGSGGLLLGMTGYERKLAQIIVGISLLNILFNALLIPKFGVQGAALATSMSLILMQVILSAYAIMEIGIDVSIFGIRYLRKNKTL